VGACVQRHASSGPQTRETCCRALEELFMAKGARIGYWRGSITGLIDDIQVCSRSPRGTMMAAGWDKQCTPFWGDRRAWLVCACVSMVSAAEGLWCHSDSYAKQPTHATSLPWTLAADAAQRASADETAASRALGRCGSRRSMTRRRARPRARAGAAADAVHRRAARVRQGVRRSAGEAGGAHRDRARALPPGLLLQTARAAARRAVGHRARRPHASRAGPVPGVVWR